MSKTDKSKPSPHPTTLPGNLRFRHHSDTNGTSFRPPFVARKDAVAEAEKLLAKHAKVK